VFFGKFQMFLSKLYTKQYNTLGWEAKTDESGRTGTLRATIISMMGKAGTLDVDKKAFELFQASISDPINSPINGDLRGTIYRSALRYDEQFVYASLKKLFEQSSFPEEQRDCLSIMGCVKDPERHRQMLDYVFNSGMVRPQDLATPLSSLASSSDYGGQCVWEYFQANYETLRARYQSGPIWPVCVGICCSGLSQSLSSADKVEEYFQSPQTPAGSGGKRLKQVLEVLRTKAKRRERDRDVVETYLLQMFP
jgi:ERAP1-like C-terminal domain